MPEVVRTRLAAGQAEWLAELRRRLGQVPGDNPHILQFEVKPKFEFLDLRDRLPDLKVKEEQGGPK